METQQPLFTREETEAHESHSSRLLGKRVVDDSKPTLLSSILLITDPCLEGWRRFQRGLRSQQLAILEPVKLTQRTGLAQNLSRSHGCRKEPGSSAWGLGSWEAEGGRRVDRATRSLAFAFDGRGHHLKVSGQGRLSSDILKSFLHDESIEYRGISNHVLTFSLRDSSSMVACVRKG